MVAIILAWQRDLHALHHSQGSIVANCSYLGGSVPTFDIKKYCCLSFLMALSHFFSKNLRINMHIFSTTLSHLKQKLLDEAQSFTSVPLFV